MQELINTLTQKAGISPDQASKAIEAIKEFVKEKFPMLGGAVDNMFASAPSDAAPTTPAAAASDSGSFMDKISDFIPGQAGEKAEDFVKGMFGGDKK